MTWTPGTDVYGTCISGESHSVEQHNVDLKSAFRHGPPGLIRRLPQSFLRYSDLLRCSGHRK